MFEAILIFFIIMTVFFGGILVIKILAEIGYYLLNKKSK